ncbi:hypothetical protein [Kitasatospora sp. NPDC001175]|uniref:hypothetical protein n=1 Tax=Kitasatospora sp. NPDC001175 TaxID=3157103 RepID=UPI003D05A727
MTGAHFIGAHTPQPWAGWTLAGAIDIAFVMALQADATLARYGSNGGGWPTTFRWLTGGFSVFANIGDAALGGDTVGILVHLIAPALLLVLGEAGPAWRRQLVSLSRMPPRLLDSCSALPRAHLHTSGLPVSNADTDDQPEVPTRPDSSTQRNRHADASLPTAASRVRTHTLNTPVDAAPPANAQEARARIVRGRLDGLSQRETARRAHRSPAFVRKVWTAMDEGPDTPRTPEKGPGAMK